MSDEIAPHGLPLGDPAPTHERDPALAPHHWLAPPPAPPAWQSAPPPAMPAPQLPFRRHEPPLTARAAALLSARLAVPALFGIAVALFFVLRRDYGVILGWEMLLVPAIAAAVAMAARRRALEIAGWAAIAAGAAYGTAAVVAPVLIFFDFLDCWASWLSDC